MKRIKYLLWFVVLLVVALVVVGFYADGLAKSAIESAGTESLGVRTTVDGVDIGFFSGTFTLEGKRVANPEGYGDGNFFELGKGSVEVSAASLLSDKIEVPAVELSKIRINLVQGLKGSNYAKILDNLAKFQGGTDARKDDDEGKRFVIEKLVIEDIEVAVASAKELDLGAVKVPIDRIELRDVGSESDKGVLLSDLTGIVLEAVLKRASVSGRLPDLIRGGLGRKLDGLKGLVGVKGLEGLADKVPTNTKDAEEALKKGVDERLKGLLGR